MFKRAILLSLLLAAVPGMMFANVLGSDQQNFNATTNGLDFVTVHSSETLKPGYINFGLFLNHAANTLPYFENPDGTKVGDTLTAADMNVGYGLFKDFDLGISFPFIVKQVVDSESDRGEFERVGNTEFRFNMKYRLLGDDSKGMALIFSTNVNRMENNPFVGIGGGPTYNYELAFDVSISKIALGLDLGFRDRNPGDPVAEFPIEPLEDQYIASAAASYHFSSINTKLIFEVFGSQPVEKVETEIFRKQSSAEGLMGIKYDASDSVAIHFGGGSELNNSIGSPDYRIYTGINVALGPLFKNKPEVVKSTETPPTPEAPPVMAEEPEAPIKEEAGPGDEVFVLKDINFVFDSSVEVLGGAKSSMAEIADRIVKKNFRHLIIEGHTDSMGTDEYNIKLGAKRAIAVRDYLVKVHGLDRSKIRAVTLGESKPIADNGNYQGRQTNRRVVFRVFYE